MLNSLAFRYGSANRTIAFDDFIMCAVKVKTMIQHFEDNDNNNSAAMDEWFTKSLYE